jgi:putative transposase
MQPLRAKSPCAVVLDVFTRRIVGWSIARHMRKESPLSALEMALQHRRPRGVIDHSDQGCQYTSAAFQGRCTAANVAVSMGSVGDCYDNAMAELFFATLECELLRRKALRSRDEAEQELFRFIEGWYNPRRRHSALGYRAPMEFEAEYWE